MTFRDAAERLHHLSMRYAGAMQELISGKPVGLMPSNSPGLKEARDFIDLILFTAFLLLMAWWVCYVHLPETRGADLTL